MSDFYTNVTLVGKDILYRGYHDGVRVKRRIPCKPYMFTTRGEGPTDYKTLKGQPVFRRDFDDPWKARDFIKTFSDAENTGIYGFENFVYPFINDQFPGKSVSYDESVIVRTTLDIEVDSRGGFADLLTANKEITAITMKTGNKIVAFGCGDFVSKDARVIYIKCADESELLKKFLKAWQRFEPDIITGWNCIPTNQSVWMKDRILPIKDIVGDLYDSVAVRRSPVSEKDLWRVHLVNGHQIGASADHKIPVVIGDPEAYTKLTFGHKEKMRRDLLTVRKISESKETVFVEVPLGRNSNRDDSRYRDSELYLAGLIYTDGTIRDKTRPSQGYRIYQSDLDLLMSLDDCGVQTKIVGSHKGCSSRNIKASLLNFAADLIYREGKKYINVELLSQLSRRQFLIFLAGILDGDGCHSAGGVSFCNFNGDLPSFYELLLWNGIFSTIADRTIRLIDFSIGDIPLRKHSRWSGPTNKQLARNSSQRARQTRYKRIGDSYYVRVARVEDTGTRCEMMDIETDTHLFISKGVRVHNCDGFDIPYLIRRFTRVFGEEVAKRLSPWRRLTTRKLYYHGTTTEVPSIGGIAVLDYQVLYTNQKFQQPKQPMYTLDFISNEVLKKGKIDYSRYETLHDLHEKNFQLFMEYNIGDVLLVDEMEDELKLIQLLLSMAYRSKVLYEDVLGSVNQWDVIIHNHLMSKNIVVPTKTNSSKEQLVGAYVKEPVPNMYKHVASFDLNSLYSHLQMGFNISYETYVGKFEDAGPLTIEQLLDGALHKHHMALLERNISVAANLSCYTRNIRGFMPALLEEMYNERLVYQAKLKDAQELREKTNDSVLLKELNRQISEYDNAQKALKVNLNSAYGCITNEYFRFYSHANAEAITMSGQMAIRWMINHMNDHLNKLLNTDGVDYIIASDTDSMYINLGPLVEKRFGTELPDKTTVTNFMDTVCKKNLEPFIEKSYIAMAEYFNALDQKMKMKRELLADIAIWTGKKRYILNVLDKDGVRLKKPKLVIKGLQTQRSDTPMACRGKLKDAISIIIDGDKDKLIKLVNDFEIEFKQLPFEEIATPKSVKDIELYTDAEGRCKLRTPAQVRAAAHFNRLLKQHGLVQYEQIYSGSRMRFAYLRTPNPTGEYIIGAPVILPKVFGLDAYIDKDRQFEKGFLDPLKSITDVIGWKTEYIHSVNEDALYTST